MDTADTKTQPADRPPSSRPRPPSTAVPMPGKPPEQRGLPARLRHRRRRPVQAGFPEKQPELVRGNAFYCTKKWHIQPTTLNALLQDLTPYLSYLSYLSYFY
jgi:hypothetical protein